MALGCLDLIITLPISILSFVLTVNVVIESDGFGFWPGWAAVHETWSQPYFSHAVYWKAFFWSVFSQRYNEYSNTPLGIVYFALFGLSPDARETYARMFWRAARLVGVRRRQPKSTVRSATPTIAFDTSSVDELEWPHG